MSDDKREKLREHLRNNRPKNRANLGNSSNNKEDFNKNLEDDSNLDNLNLNNNSNLDNSQIPNNKTNSNKRDYDEEPLVLKDYTVFMRVDLVFNGILIILTGVMLTAFMETMNFRFLFCIFFIVIIFYFIELYIYSALVQNNYIVKLTNKKALFYKNKNLIKDFDIKIDANFEFFSPYYRLREFDLHVLSVFIIFLFLDTKFSLKILSIFIILFGLIYFYGLLIQKMIYKNGNLNNFLKHRHKFQIDIGWIRTINGPTKKGISLFYFNEKDYKSLKEYLNTIFYKNLDKDIKSIR
ncbi:hypothetical protein CE91St25_17490 [Campylobacter ureolyticus]|uniref:hypothetical protein n=1 Tax=Campylobacter ureolyticus TaxID=827 RepID=UPI001FC87249|nr:hypothetical protein [Campylobacter ureolyticus]GKH61413.1 hypothetical protein CE91St25_17490 [Campylobacter ureolyticus]